MTTTIQLELGSIRSAWIETHAPTVREYARTVPSFTSDDVRKIIPEPKQCNHIGALLARLRNQGFIKPIGFEVSTRKAANGRVVRRWKLND